MAHINILRSSPKKRPLKCTAFMQYTKDSGWYERISASFKTFAPKKNKIFQEITIL
jgi:hypothetical protein